MGADARLYVFDFDLYRDHVAPAFSRLLQSGEFEPWLLTLILSHGEELDLEAEAISTSGFPASGIVPADFSKWCTYLDNGFAVKNTFQRTEESYKGSWDARACRSLGCHIRHSCPFHLLQGAQMNLLADDWIRWLQLAITKRCLGNSIFLGRSLDCFFYWDQLDALALENGHPIRSLLVRLGRRGFVVGYRGSSGTEGIHGWLTTEETRILADELFAIPLPEYEYSFSRMESFRQRRDLLAGQFADFQFPVLTYEHPNASFEELSLSFVRTVCWLAARDGKGVLWGNDLA